MNDISKIFNDGIFTFCPNIKDRIILYKKLITSEPNVFMLLLQQNSDRILNEIFSNELDDMFINYALITFQQKQYDLKTFFETFISYLMNIKYPPICIPNECFGILVNNNSLCIKCYNYGYVLNNINILPILFKHDHVKFIELIDNESYENVLPNILDIINNSKIQIVLELFSLMDNNKIKIIVNFGKTHKLNEHILLGLLTCEITTNDIITMKSNNFDLFSYYNIHMYFNKINFEVFKFCYANKYLKSSPQSSTLLYILFELTKETCTTQNQNFINRVIVLYIFFCGHFELEFIKQELYNEILKQIIPYMSKHQIFLISDEVLSNKQILSYENGKIKGIYAKYAPLIVSVSKIYNLLDSKEQKTFCIDNLIYGLDECSIEDLDQFDEKIIEHHLSNKELIDYIQIMEENKKKYIMKKFCNKYKLFDKSHLLKLNDLFEGLIKHVYHKYANVITKQFTGLSNVIPIESIMLSDEEMLNIMTTNNEDNLKCKICFEENINKACNECGNTCCENCYNKLQKKNKPVCPYCNGKLLFFNVRY